MSSKLTIPQSEFFAQSLELMLKNYAEAAQTWSYRDWLVAMELTAAETSEHSFARIQDFCVELLTGYPKRRFGIPVLMHIEERDRSVMHPVQLPLPTEAPVGVEYAYWYSLSSRRDTIAHGVCSGKPVKVLTNTFECAVLILVTSDSEPPEITNEFYGELFTHAALPGRVDITCPHSYEWPRAVDAAVAMLAGARSRELRLDALPSPFLDRSSLSACFEAGARFAQQVQARQAEGI